MAQNYGRSMAGDFNDIFRRIGTRRFKVSHDNLVDDIAALVKKAGEGGRPGSPLVPGGEFEDSFRDAARVGAGQTNDSYA